jgi:hypothetical protein
MPNLKLEIALVAFFSFATPKRDSSTARPGPQIAEGAICGKKKAAGTLRSE